MKQFIASIFVCTLAIWAQDSSASRSTSVDINGRRVTNGPEVVQTKSSSGADVTERVQSVNGRSVPIERIEERVLRDDASGRVVERVIRSFSPTGDPLPPVKETIEEQKRSDGGSTIQTTTYRGDINGAMQLLRKSTTDVQISGSAQSVNTVVQQPTINGSLETVEKRNTVKLKESGDNYREDSTTYRRDANGNFVAAVQQATLHTQQGSEATDQTAQYEIGPDGRLQLHSQTVAKTVKGSDGSMETELNVFGANVAGTVDPSSKLKLQEQQLIEKRPGPGNSVVETMSVRHPSVADPNALGPARQISETVCRGKCDK